MAGSRTPLVEIGHPCRCTLQELIKQAEAYLKQASQQPGYGIMVLKVHPSAVVPPPPPPLPPPLASVANRSVAKPLLRLGSGPPRCVLSPVLLPPPIAAHHAGQRGGGGSASGGGQF